MHTEGRRIWILAVFAKTEIRAESIFFGFLRSRAPLAGVLDAPISLVSFGIAARSASAETPASKAFVQSRSRKVFYFRQPPLGAWRVRCFHPPSPRQGVQRHCAGTPLASHKGEGGGGKYDPKLCLNLGNSSEYSLCLPWLVLPSPVTSALTLAAASGACCCSSRIAQEIAGQPRHYLLQRLQGLPTPSMHFSRRPAGSSTPQCEAALLPPPYPLPCTPSRCEPSRPSPPRHPPETLARAPLYKACWRVHLR